MTYKETKDILRVAAAEAEWNCPLDYNVLSDDFCKYGGRKNDGR